MTIIQVPQGRYASLAGLPRIEALDLLRDTDQGFLDRNPTSVKYYRPSWSEFDAKDTETAPWGYEWYQVDADGRLQRHSAHYDSSG